MTDIDPNGNPRYSYVQIADALTARIQAGQITGRLPAERQLADEFGVAYGTLRHGIAMLRQRGLVITRHGRGSFVTHPAWPEPPS